MSTNNHRFPKPGETNPAGQNNNSPSVFLTPKEVANRLHVSEKSAKRIMMELPHVLVSMDMYCGKRRIRITEETLEGFARGTITRKRLRRAG